MAGLDPATPSEIEFDFAGNATMPYDRVDGRDKSVHDG
jgi:hypothetical protein